MLVISALQMHMAVSHTEQCILGKLTVSIAADSIRPFKSTNYSYPLYCRWQADHSNDESKVLRALHSFKLNINKQHFSPSPLFSFLKIPWPFYYLHVSWGYHPYAVLDKVNITYDLKKAIFMFLLFMFTITHEIKNTLLRKQVSNQTKLVSGLLSAAQA